MLCVWCSAFCVLCVQEAALRACLEGWGVRGVRLLALPRLGMGWARSGRGLSLRKYKNTGGGGSCLSQRQVVSRGLNRRILPLAGVFRPPRRATRRCPPWTRTGLVSGDRKATWYWALGFGYGAAPAGASDSPARHRPGIVPPCAHLDSKPPTTHPAHPQGPNGRVGSESSPVDKDAPDSIPPSGLK